MKSESIGLRKFLSGTEIDHDAALAGSLRHADHLDLGGDGLCRCGKQRGARGSPGTLAGTGEIEAPYIAEQIAGIHIVDDVIAVQISGGDIGDAALVSLVPAFPVDR